MSHKFRAICLHPVNATPWGSTSDRQDSKSRNSFCDFCAFCGELSFFTRSHPIVEKAGHHVCRHNDWPHCQSCKTLSRMMRSVRRGLGSQTNGSFPKGAGRLSEKSPPGYAPPNHRDDPPGSAGVPPASSAFRVDSWFVFSSKMKTVVGFSSKGPLNREGARWPRLPLGARPEFV